MARARGPLAAARAAEEVALVDGVEAAGGEATAPVGGEGGGEGGQPQQGGDGDQLLGQLSLLCGGSAIRMDGLRAASYGRTSSDGPGS